MKKLSAKFRINTGAEEVFRALTDSFILELWTGYPAIMKPSEGSEFELWDGDICGMNIELVENKKIVQEWYFGEPEEKSIVTMILKPKGKATIIELTHENIPDDAFDNIRGGWHEIYFKSLQEFYK